MNRNKVKSEFESGMLGFVSGLNPSISTTDGQWTIKGFIDVFENIYTISRDTKIVSKILEIHLLPIIAEQAKRNGFKIVLAEHQNYYPDLSFVRTDDDSVKFAVDLKTTYRKPNKPHLCNGFTLGSHGEYFTNRTSTKNIQFPYSQYLAHYCLGIIYDRTEAADEQELRIHKLKELKSVTSVIGNFQFFFVEKWKIASDKSGSGNTANIGSINNIDDIVNGRGMFSKLGEKWFDDYWMNYNQITIADKAGGTKKITSLREFVKYRKGPEHLVIQKNNDEGEQ